jgi:hypothetical protein
MEEEEWLPQRQLNNDDDLGDEIVYSGRVNSEISR